jgi:predicted nucleic acid-binding protein
LKTIDRFVNIKLNSDMIVADASVLIALAKLRKLDLLRLMYQDVLIGPEVKVETIDAGKKISASGAERIERALDDGWLRIARLSQREKKTAQNIVSKSRLHPGEAESIALASSRGLMVILDDREARSFAEGLGIEFLGTAGIVLQGFVTKHLKFAELEDTIRELSQTIWLSPAVVAEILKKAREFER